MIEEASHPKDQTAIELGDSPIRDLSQRVMDIIPPSPYSKKGVKINGSSECSSRQGVNSKLKIEVEDEEKQLDFYKEEDVEERKTKRKRFGKTKKIGKGPKKMMFRVNKGTPMEIQYRLVKKEGLGTVDIGIQTKPKTEKKLLVSVERREQEEPPVKYDLVKSEDSSKQRPHQYSIKSYQEKLKIVEVASAKGNHYAAKKFNVSINNIHRWKISCKRRPGAGRKINDPTMEKALIDWMGQFKEKYQAVPQRKEVRAKAVSLSKHRGFQASKGWYERFMDRNPDFRSLPKMRAVHNKPRSDPTVFVKVENESYSSEEEMEVESESEFEAEMQSRSQEMVYMSEDGKEEKEREDGDIKIEMEAEPSPEPPKCFEFSTSKIPLSKQRPNELEWLFVERKDKTHL